MIPEAFEVSPVGLLHCDTRVLNNLFVDNYEIRSWNLYQSQNTRVSFVGTSGAEK